jgi:hypothetical protein
MTDALVLFFGILVWLGGGISLAEGRAWRLWRRWPDGPPFRSYVPNFTAFLLLALSPFLFDFLFRWIGRQPGCGFNDRGSCIFLGKEIDGLLSLAAQLNVFNYLLLPMFVIAIVALLINLVRRRPPKTRPT